MKEHVQLDGLLFSSDAQVLGVMNQILDSFATKQKSVVNLTQPLKR